MKTRRFTAILIALVILAFVSSDVAIPAANNGKIPVLIGFRRTPGPSEQALVHAFGGDISFSYHIVPAIAASVPPQAMRGLQNNPNVTYIEEDTIAYAVAETLPWGVNRIDADEVWDADHNLVASGDTGSGVNVAIIDSGIDYNHEDLYSNVKGGYDFVNMDDDPLDDCGHGTHVAGIVAALDNDKGVIGVAPGANLYAVKVLNKQGWGRWSQIIAGIEWCVDTGYIDVINMSIGGGYSASMGTACQKAYDAGIVIVAAAGNEDGSVSYPAAYPSVIAVAATDNSDSRASFSNYGPQVELAAPGVSIPSTFPTYRVGMGYYPSGYVYMSGTSMASPHVAGVAALVIADGVSDFNNDGKINNDDVRFRLVDTAEDLGSPGWDQYYGSGLVDAEAAVSAAPANNAPTVNITSPADGSNFASGTSVTISGTAYDDEEGNLSNYITWYINGQEWSTGSSAVITPVDGTYAIEASITDSGGLEATDSITITVGDAPSVEAIYADYTTPAVVKTKDAGKNHFYEATTVVSVWDLAGVGVGGATVYGTWTIGSSTAATQGITDSNGDVTFTCTIKTTSTSPLGVDFQIDGVVKDGYEYQP